MKGSLSYNLFVVSGPRVQAHCISKIALQCAAGPLAGGKRAQLWRGPKRKVARPQAFFIWQCVMNMGHY